MTLHEETTPCGKTIKIWQDEDAESPREWCSDTVFIIRGTRVMSPDEYSDGDFPPAGAISLPVWHYTHSGSMYQANETNPFSCPWDSGQAGFIWITREDARKDYGVERISSKLLTQIYDRLRGEVEVYSDWANGQVFGYSIHDEDDEVIDCCGGFYGDWDHAIEEAKQCL
jgi:hypothetical protein